MTGISTSHENGPLRTPASVWIATAGGAGFAPKAPGTAGAALAVVLFFGLAGLSLPLYALTLVALSFLGVWASDQAERFFDSHDDGRIVIDEVAGQLLALAPLVPRSGGGDRPALFFGLVVTGFVAFRLFDIWKPGPVRWAQDRFAGGLGVMADDLVAGVLAAFVVIGAMAALSAGGI